MDISSFPCTQLVFAFSLGWTLKEVNINGDFNQYIWAFSLGWTQETDVRVTSSSLLISSGKPEEVFPTNIFSVLNECPPLSTEPKLFNTIPTQFLLSHFYPHWFSTEPKVNLLALSIQSRISSPLKWIMKGASTSLLSLKRDRKKPVSHNLFDELSLLTQKCTLPNSSQQMRYVMAEVCSPESLYSTNFTFDESLGFASGLSSG